MHDDHLPAAPHQRVLQFLQDGSVDLVTEVLDGALLCLEHNRGLVVRQLTFRFSVDTDQLQVLPHLFKQVVIVPLVMSRDRHCMRDLNNLLNNQIIQIFPDLADDIQFLDADLINLVQQVDAGDVRAVTLNCVDKLIGSSIAPNITFRIVIKGKQTWWTLSWRFT